MKARGIPITICAAAAAIVMMLAGCTMTVTSDGIDPEEVVEALEAQTGESVTLQCPDDIPFEAGLVTVCPATLDGANAILTITQVNDEGLADFVIGKFLNVDAMPSVIEAEIGVPVEVMCPGDVPLEAGLVTECPATLGEANAVVVLTQKDNLGNLSWTYDTALNLDTLPSAIEAEIGAPVEVQCPADIPFEEGLVVECLISDGESEGILLVTQKDNLGTINWAFG
jgi:hypothetical protein